MEPELITLEKVEFFGGKIVKMVPRVEGVFPSFGELYSSSLEYGLFRGFKKHKHMDSLIFVVEGEVSFHFVRSDQSCFTIQISRFSESHNALRIPSSTVFGFRSVSSTGSTLINFASQSHDPKEVLRFENDFHECDWTK